MLVDTIKQFKAKYQELTASELEQMIKDTALYIQAENKRAKIDNTSKVEEDIRSKLNPLVEVAVTKILDYAKEELYIFKYATVKLDGWIDIEKMITEETDTHEISRFKYSYFVGAICRELEANGIHVKPSIRANGTILDLRITTQWLTD